MRHFLDIRDFDTATLQAMLDDAAAMKAALKGGVGTVKPLSGKSVAMIFEKPSTRTRVSFEVGISQLGGTPLMLLAQDLQIGRGESIEDTARVLSRYVDAITIRCFSHDTLLTLAEHATVPVINALTARSHPCQIMADLQTMIERHGALEGQVVTWIGDGNNVAQAGSKPPPVSVSSSASPVRRVTHRRPNFLPGPVPRVPILCSMIRRWRQRREARRLSQTSGYRWGTRKERVARISDRFR